MKKFTKVFIIICLLMLFVLSAVACSTTGTLGKDNEGRFKLAVPKVEINNNTLKWKEVKYCEKYGVQIDDQEEIEVKKTSYTLIIEEQKQVKVKVRALGDDIKTVSSAYSKEVQYKSNGRLADPQAPTIKEEGDNWVINWNEIANAKYYLIKQGRTIQNQTTSYKSDTNSLSINKSEFSEPDIYNFTVQACNTEESGFLNSNFSEASNKYVTTTLKTPEPKYIDDGSTDVGMIKWDKISVSGISINYKIWLSKDEGEYLNVKTQSSNNIYKSDYARLIKDYVKLEKNIKNDEDVKNEDLVGEYTIKVQAISTANTEVYKESEKAIVNSRENGEVKVIKKPAGIDNIKFVADEENGDKLIWDKQGDYKRYTVLYKSNQTQLREATFEGTEDNLKEKLKESHGGKVTTIAVSVAEDSKNGILQGVETLWTVDGKVGEYCYIPKEAPDKIAEGDFKDYMKIENLGHLAYMLKYNQVGEKYLLNNDINANNVNIYGGEGDFNALFDGNNKAISKLNIIKSPTDNSENLSLFGKIGEEAIIQNLVLDNSTIKSEEMQSIALIANENRGTIDKVNVVGVTIESKGNISGFVNKNYADIISCGFLNSTITGAGDVASFAITNDGRIFNASVVQCQIVSETTDKTSRAGGIVTVNDINGSIENSFVFNRKTSSKRDSKVYATSWVKENEQFAFAGGLVAINRGKITSCYVSGENPRQNYINAKVDYPATGDHMSIPLSRKSYAGGLVAQSEGGVITSCYVTRMKITADSFASGLIGYKDDVSNVEINDCFVFNLGLSATTTAKILKSTDNVVINRVYVTNNFDTEKGASLNNATVVENSALIDPEKAPLNGFTAVKEYAASYPILSNMLYVKNDNYSVSASSTTENLTIYLGGKASDKVESLVKISDKVELYSVTIGEEDNKTTLVLPIFFAW